MKKIFVSYAANDPAWDSASVSALAQAIDATGSTVLLDERHTASQGRKLSLAEWRSWKSGAREQADRFLCLASERCAAFWMREVDVPGGYGVSHEAIPVRPQHCRSEPPPHHSRHQTAYRLRRDFQ